MANDAKLKPDSGTRRSKSQLSCFGIATFSVLLLQPILSSRPVYQELAPGNQVDRALSGGEAHSYRITVKAAQLLRIIVNQNGIDVVLRLFGPDGQKLVEVDSPNGRHGPEPVTFLTKHSGDYKLEVNSPEKAIVTGRYKALLEPLRPPDKGDAVRIEAERLESEGVQLFVRGDPESLRRALVKYEKAIDLWKSIEKRAEEANAVTVRGQLFVLLKDHRSAIESYERVLLLWREASDRQGDAQTLSYLGETYYKTGDRQRALDSYKQALLIWKAIENRLREAETLNNIGVIYDTLGEHRKGIDYLSQALERRGSDVEGSATTLDNLGITHSHLGEGQKALRFHKQAYELWTKAGDRTAQAATLNYIGLIYFDSGLAQQALDAYGRALAISREAQDKYNEAVTLNNTGRTLTMLGDPREDHYNDARKIYERLKDSRGEAETLNYLGMNSWSSWLSGDDSNGLEKALKYYDQALPLRRKVGDKAGEAATLNNIGLALESKGESRIALDRYNEALRIWPQTTDRSGEATTLNNIGLICEALGQRQNALDYYVRALRLGRQNGDQLRVARALYDIARFERASTQLGASLAKAEEAVRIVESFRTNLASPELRIKYRSSVQRYYELNIDLLMRLHRRQPAGGFAGKALEASEHARARGLVDLLSESGARVNSGVDPSLLDLQRDLQQQLNARAVERVKLQSSGHNRDEEQGNARALDQVRRELLDVETRIRVSSPRYAALTRPPPPGLKEIQNELLDPDTLLLEYSLGEERSYLWAVTTRSFTSRELPGRIDLEASAFAFLSVIGSEGPKASTGWDQSTYLKRGRSLSNTLLGPVAHLLGKKRLLVVADGALQYIPFGALPIPGNTGTDGRGWQPLVVNHEILSLPSASTLAALRAPTPRERAPKSALVLADPVFDSRDRRVTRPDVAGVAVAIASDGQETPLSRRLSGELKKRTGAGTFPRLDHTRDEAVRILGLLPEGEGRMLLDFEANRTAALSETLSNYRYIHFATHGWLDRERPELSAIVLSLVNETGLQQDGFLRLHEVYNLRLRAELVVLSACDTGGGKEVRGEGIVGLTRGFMYAGAPRVVVSLWSVNDEATAELMARFYRGLLKDGLRPAAALRAAQISMWEGKRSHRWQAPYYWAAFVIQGEYR